MTSSLYLSLDNEILNDYAYAKIQPLIFCSQIVKTNVDSNLLSDMRIEYKNVSCRTKD